MRVIIFFILNLILTTALAAPREIIIIRHADKLDQDESGPALSATGMVRSIKFAYYFLQKFGEPDFIFSAGDTKDGGKEIAIRSLQTVAPLANIMQERHPEADYPILHHYSNNRYDLLAYDLLHNAIYNNKLIIICWSHQRIAKLAEALGVRSNIPEWPRSEYDTVYVLQYTSSSNANLTELKQQFPIRQAYTWEALRQQFEN